MFYYINFTKCHTHYFIINIPFILLLSLANLLIILFITITFYTYFMYFIYLNKLKGQKKATALCHTPNRVYTK